MVWVSRLSVHLSDRWHVVIGLVGGLGLGSLKSVRIWIALNSPINSGQIYESEFGELRCSIRTDVKCNLGDEQPSRSWPRLV